MFPRSIIIITDSELKQAQRSYSEQKWLGTEHVMALSQELFCRLIRNVMTNMISIARATDDSSYPSKHQVNAIAKRLVENYPMIKDRSSNCEWVSTFLLLLFVYYVYGNKNCVSYYLLCNCQENVAKQLRERLSNV